MTKTCLVLQVLGTSDIKIEGEKGGLWSRINGPSHEDIIENLEDIEEGNYTVQFPIIESLLRLLKNKDQKIILGIILSDQADWANNKYETINHSQIWDLVAKDGIWAKNLLEQWLKTRGVDYYLLPFRIDPDFEYGVADWEATDKKIIPWLKKYLIQTEAGLFWQYEPEEPQKVDKIIIQHSTGSPALKSSLYLWGIEKKLAKYPVEFIYLSEDEKCLYDLTPTHSGESWQWHLRLPLIRELLDIKDFSGALKLVQNVPKSNPINATSIKQEIEDKLSFLDKAVSFNLIGMGLNARQEIIERIAIALWSEQSYQIRKHWMHWYLRLVGAFELAILLLVEKQGQGEYQWRGKKLLFSQEKKYGEVGRCGIKNILEELLSKGILEYNFYDREEATKFTVTEISKNQQWNQENWNDFIEFYLTKWQELNVDNPGFSSLRNKLYHQLVGDTIDEALDCNTQAAKKAVEYLKHILELGGISPEINARIKFYQDRYNKLSVQLLQLNIDEKIQSVIY